MEDCNVGDLYGWVDPRVKRYVSQFDDEESVRLLGSDSWVRVGSGIKIELLPCERDDRVCHRRDDWSFFFMYSCLFTELGVRLPFTDFECGVLYWLNCAPTQLHPNSWGFVRAFEVLMELLECPPSLRLFFSLFQAKGVNRGLWVNLSSYPCRAVFGLYKSSFKDFKSMFVKVRSVPEDFPFYLNEHLVERFSLFWCSEPYQALDVDDRLPDDDIVMDFLFKSLGPKGSLSVAEMLKWDTDRQAVYDHIGEKAPAITTTSLKLFFNQCKKGEKEISSNVGKGPAVLIHHGLGQKQKRKRGQGQGSLAEVLEGKGESSMILQMVESAYESQKRLHRYDENMHARSLWAKLYPFGTMADELCCFPDDMKMIDEVGRAGVSRFLQVIGARIVSIGRTQELTLDREQNEASRVEELSGIIQKKVQKIAELSASMEKKELELADERNLQKTSSEKLKILESENDQFFARIKELEGGIYEAFAQGFERAVSQVKVLYPEADSSKLDVMKVVVNGELIEDEAVAGSESEGSSIGDKAD
ncbi:uncharacterized protein [Arachis hypogaea]|uniref:uncharacterized protein n=1 Tax=Arachis hypogaea TaxID=3818 RepID=UPI003B20E0F1